MTFVTYTYMAVFDPKNDDTERKETLSSLPEVHRLNRSTDREIDLPASKRFKQFIWPTSGSLHYSFRKKYDSKS